MTIAAEIPGTIARGGRGMVAVWSSRQITYCVLRYVVGVSIVVALRDDKTSHVSNVPVIPVPSICFPVYSIHIGRYNHTYK